MRANKVESVQLLCGSGTGQGSGGTEECEPELAKCNMIDLGMWQCKQGPTNV